MAHNRRTSRSVDTGGGADQAISALTLRGGPQAIGRAHGAAYAERIQAYARERTQLAAAGTWSGGRSTPTALVLELAEATLEAHEHYAPDLYEEMAALARTAGISEREAVVLGGFTDLVDLIRARAFTEVEEDDCTAVLVPPALSGGAGLFAQTWDMHGSASRYITVLRLEPDGHPAAVVFTTTGCLGQIGMNEAGIVVGITTLSAQDGRPGVTWPFVVRKALQQVRVEDVLACVLDAELAGGHNYLIMGADGAGYAVEAMPGRSAVEKTNGEVIIRTNHCLDSATIALQAQRPTELMASSVARLRRAHELVQKGSATIESLQALTKDTGTICRSPSAPHHVGTLGALVARPGTREMWITAGNPSVTSFQRIEVGGPG